MTPEALQTLRDALLAARQPVERAEQYAFPRGWNEALDFVERKIKEAIGEEFCLMNNGIWWTDHDTQRLIYLREVRKLSWAKVGKAMGRTLKSCEQHHYRIRHHLSAYKRSYQPHTLAAPRTIGRAQPDGLPQQAPASPRAKAVASSSALLVDAELRGRIELVGITAGLFGDPLPGRSALDRKRGTANVV